MSADENLNPAQFEHLYHGTRAVLAPGDHIESGHGDNYPEAGGDPDREGKVYATPSRAHAAKFAHQALGSGKPRVYAVRPTGHVEWDEETQPEDYESDTAMNRHGSRRSSSPFEVSHEMRASRMPSDM